MGCCCQSSGCAPEYQTVTSGWSASDWVGAWRCRLGSFRNRYRVNPGLYALGTPDSDSDVFVTANYRFSFNLLRRSLSGHSAWLLVLDTAGINVWCAAGKGSFGTDELIRRLEAVKLEKFVSHRTLILPQLGAPGVAAPVVEERTGFRVIWGPVRADDIPDWLAAGRRATPQMRRVTFTLRERLAVIPLELNTALRYGAIVIFWIWILAIGFSGWSFFQGWNRALPYALGIVGGIVAGAIITPLFLPWLPFRSFSLNGALTGLLVASGYLSSSNPETVCQAGFVLLMVTGLSSGLALLFTGATPITSPSGVRLEMRYAARPLMVLAVLGLICLLGGLAGY